MRLIGIGLNIGESLRIVTFGKWRNSIVALNWVTGTKSPISRLQFAVVLCLTSESCVLNACCRLIETHWHCIIAKSWHHYAPQQGTQLRKHNSTYALCMHWINASNECDVRTVRNMVSPEISTHSHTKRFCLHPINFYCFVASYLTLIVLQIVRGGDYRRVPTVHTTFVCVNAPPRLACL